MKYEYLLLDLDNTLFDFSRAEYLALEWVMKKQNAAFCRGMAERYGQINDACWKMLEKGQIKKDRLIVYRFELFLKEFGIKGDAALFNRLYMERLADSPLLFEGAVSFLEKLAEKYRLFAITNGTAFVQEKRLAASGLDRFFEKVFISEHLGAEKPAPLFFEKVSDSIEGFLKEKALVIGDSLSGDILGAENYGIDAMWYNPQSKKNDQGVSPIYTVQSYGEAEKILNV